MGHWQSVSPKWFSWPSHKVSAEQSFFGGQFSRNVLIAHHMKVSTDRSVFGSEFESNGLVCHYIDISTD